jgi:hypothetical protein
MMLPAAPPATQIPAMATAGTRKSLRFAMFPSRSGDSFTGLIGVRVDAAGEDSLP